MYGENTKPTIVAGGIGPAAAGFLRGLLIATFVTLILFFAFACLLAYTALPETLIPIIAIVAQVLGALISGYFTVKKTGSRGFLTGLAAGILYDLILWLIASLVGDAFCIGTHFFVMLFISAIGGAIGGVMSVNLKMGKSNRRKR